MAAPIDFEWDDAKAASNEAKHGVPFEYATRVFHADDRIDVPSPRSDVREPRFVAFGTVEGFVFAVVFAVRGEAVRIVSARRASRAERARHARGG